MKQPRYLVRDMVMDAAEVLRNSSDQSTTTIRCTMNDVVEQAARQGFAVNHDYNQDRAVKSVKWHLNKWNKERS